MKRTRHLVVRVVQLAVIIFISYELTRLLFQYKWDEKFGISRNNGDFFYNILLHESYSSLTGNLNQTYYVSSQMEKYENKITLGFTEKDLEELYKVKSAPAARKIILNYGDLYINIIRNFSFCFACDCELIFDRSRWLEADVIILTDHLYPKGPRPPNQLWFIFVHVPPLKIRIADGLENKECKRVAPPHSFIHVDQFESPAKLADYLKYLDRNETAYNEYFAWHEHGTIDAWSPMPQCVICLLAHTAHKLKPYTFPNVSKWWNDGCVGRKIRWNFIH
ncbi:putative alpha(1,3)fucosyltransferase [Schistosoma mansoni]|uniref:putative alpha(1,3)fucosyltransferase n=1 Tax=Schistosoma mansoni TaxID=6183 RepID=UPI00022DC9A6|nr:putative alpha(1,3)fucosyltransferase [Schistosoma mansoni]|eukprot:XP_018655238.1 putative alpha(1,3)fucosyltransferase [Schistosoma mansoni]